MNDSAAGMVYYIQTSLYDGRQPEAEGFYIFTKKELAEKLGLALTTVHRNIGDVVQYFSSWCDLSSWAKYPELAGEVLYTDVSYERGVLKFKQNPLTLRPDLSFLWALPPLNSWFSYDAFDAKHRRRCNGSQMRYDAIPWSWDADQHEEELERAREDIQKHLLQGKNSEKI